MTEIIKVETPEQIAAVAEIARKIWTDHYVPIVGKAQVDYMLEKFQSKEAITDQLKNGYEYYLLRHNEEDAGYMGLIRQNNELMISKLYVSEAVRGKGLGRYLIRFAEEQCRKSGLRKMWLTVNKNNATSIEWYLRSGFTNAGDIRMDIGSGFVMDDYRMEKTISAL